MILYPFTLLRIIVLEQKVKNLEEEHETIIQLEKYLNESKERQSTGSFLASFQQKNSLSLLEYLNYRKKHVKN